MKNPTIITLLRRKGWGCDASPASVVLRHHGPALVDPLLQLRHGAFPLGESLWCRPGHKAPPHHHILLVRLSQVPHILLGLVSWTVGRTIVTPAVGVMRCQASFLPHPALYIRGYWGAGCGVSGLYSIWLMFDWLVKVWPLPVVLRMRVGLQSFGYHVILVSCRDGLRFISAGQQEIERQNICETL